MTVALGLVPTYPGLRPFAAASSDASAYAATVSSVPSMNAKDAIGIGGTDKVLAPNAVVEGGANTVLGQQVSEVTNENGQVVFAAPITPSTSIISGTAASTTSIATGGSFSLYVSGGRSQGISLSSSTPVGFFQHNQSAASSMAITSGDPITVVLGPSGDALAVIDNTYNIHDAQITGVSTNTSGNTILTLTNASGTTQVVTVNSNAVVMLDGSAVSAAGGPFDPSALRTGMVVSLDTDSSNHAIVVNEAPTLPALFRPAIQDADKAGISVLLPTQLPAPPPGLTWSLDGYHLNASGYAFSLAPTNKALPPRRLLKNGLLFQCFRTG